MKKILIAVDGTKASQNVLSVFHNFIHQPVNVVLLHVERLQGQSIIIDMLGDPEMSTLKEMMAGTEHKEALDKRAEQILAFYEKELKLHGSSRLKAIRRDGFPSEEILKVAKEEGAELIILGHSGKRGIDRFITGTVSDYIQKNSKVPVIVAKRTLTSEEPYSYSDAYAAVYVTTAVIIALLLFGAILESELLP